MRFAILRNFSLVTLGLASPALADINAALATADAVAGQRDFRKCIACHAVEQGGANKIGPNLFGIVGAPVAEVEGFSYSDALASYGGARTPERLDAFLTRPRGEVKGTKMSFAGLRNAEDRANLIAYLNTHSESSMSFGAVEVAAATEAAEEYEFGVLFDAPGVEATYYACTACHSEMIVAQQGLTRDEWDEMFDWMVEEQGMSEIEEPERSEILDYLAAHYNTDRPNFPRDLGN